MGIALEYRWLVTLLAEPGCAMMGDEAIMGLSLAELTTRATGSASLAEEQERTSAGEGWPTPSAKFIWLLDLAVLATVGLANSSSDAATSAGVPVHSI